MARPRYFQVSTTKTVHEREVGVPRQALLRGREMPTAPRIVSTTPYCGWSSWNQTTPAITSDSTYGTKTIVRSRPRPRILRLSSSAIARPEGQLDQDRDGRR